MRKIPGGPQRPNSIRIMIAGLGLGSVLMAGCTVPDKIDCGEGFQGEGCADEVSGTATETTRTSAPQTSTAPQTTAPQSTIPETTTYTPPAVTETAPPPTVVVTPSPTTSTAPPPSPVTTAPPPPAPPALPANIVAYPNFSDPATHNSCIAGGGAPYVLEIHQTPSCDDGQTLTYNSSTPMEGHPITVKCETIDAQGFPWLRVVDQASGIEGYAAKAGTTVSQMAIAAC